MVHAIPDDVDAFAIVLRGLADSCPAVLDGRVTAEELLRSAALHPCPRGGARHKALHQALNVLPIECVTNTAHLRRGELSQKSDALTHEEPN